MSPGDSTVRRPASAFISYARADGEAIAVRLRDRISREHPGITLWQDRSEMYGGVGWWQQIEQALQNVSFLIIVMTPAALASETTRKEWRYARQQGVCVFPVKGLPDEQMDWQAMPKWMSRSHFYDLHAEWETFVQHLKSPCSQTRVPFMAPDLPENLVGRAAEFDALLDRILDREREEPIAATTSIQGAGGFGKTTIAKALCHDDRVVTAFVDGILWVTLGQTPDLRREVTRLHRALTGGDREFLDVEEATQQLAQVLAEKHCLIVVDDVWFSGHLKPFLRGGRHCSRLVTTRRLDVIAEFPGPIKVDEMRPDEAVRLLMSRLSAEPQDDSDVRALASRLGAWPLLLRLAASAMQSRVARGEPPSKALKYVSRALDEKGITAFDRSDAESRNDAVAKTIGVSLDLLTDDSRRRCLELAIFPEDVDIPVSVAAVLWNLDEIDTEKCAERLADLALVDLDLGRGYIQIHDVIRQFFTGQLADAVPVHARLVAGWGSPLQLTHRYAVRWLCYHMARAGQVQPLLALLLDYRWLQHKLEIAGVNALLDDFRRGIADAAVAEVERAVRQSAHLLAGTGADWRGPSQLALQLIARLPERDEPAIAGLRSAASAALLAGDAPLLHPLTASLSESTALIRTLSGHSRPVASLVALDDRRIVSGSWDKTIRIWNLETGETETILQGDRGPVFALIALGNGRLVAAQAGVIRLWNLATQRIEATLKFHRGSVFALARMPDGRMASGSGDDTVRIWSVAAGVPDMTLKGHTGSVFALAALPDGRLASGGGDGAVNIWDLTTGVIDMSLRGHSGAVLALAALQDGRLASGASDESIRIWNLGTGTSDIVLGNNNGRVYALHALADGRLASGSSDRTVRAWDLRTSEAAILTGHGDWVKAVLPLGDGRIASASDDRTLKLWQLDAAPADSPAGFHRDWVKALAVLPGGRLASGSTDSTIKVWRLSTRQCEATLFSRGASANALAVLPNGRLASAGSRDRTIKLWDLASAQVVATLAGHTRPVSAIALLSDQRLASGAGDATIRVWNLQSGKTERVLSGHGGPVHALLRLSERTLASASADATVRVWNLDSGKLEATLMGHTAWVLALTRLADQRLVSASRDKTIRLWNPSGYAAAGTLEAHGDWVRAVTPVGPEALASGSDDCTIRIWWMRNRQWQNRVAFVADSGVKSLAFSEPDATLMAGDASGRIHFLKLSGLPQVS